jgi:hypothetical protein
MDCMSPNLGMFETTIGCIYKHGDGTSKTIPMHGLQLLETINQHFYAGKIPKIGTSTGVTSRRNSPETPVSLDSNLLDNLTLVLKSCSAFEAAAAMQARLAGCSPSG